MEGLNKYCVIIKIEVLLFLLSGATYIYAQPNNNSPQKYLKCAERSAELNDYLSAIQMLEKYLELKPNNISVKEKLVGYYYLNKQYEQSIALINEISEKEVLSDLLIQKAALCKKALGEYKEAIKLFEQCRKKTKQGSLSVECRKAIDGCNKAIDSKYGPDDITVLNLGNLNTSNIEMAPSFLNDSVIVYSTLNSDKVVELSIYDSANVSRTRLYYAYLSDTTWYKGKELPNIINDNNYDINNGTFAVNTDRFYFTKCSKNWLNKKVCRIYTTNFNKYRYTELQNLEFNGVNENYTVTQPTVGAIYDENYEVVYFASDMPGGAGGMDIWYVVFDKRKHSYTKPKNLGRRINSEYNEITPFYNNETKTLFFSSNRPTGFGGFDIYKSAGSLRSWFSVTNLNYPVNTNADEMSYVINKNQVNGFLVSNRKGGKMLGAEYCCYDIYEIKINSVDRVLIKGNLMAVIDPSINKFLNNGIQFSQSDSLEEYNLNVALYRYHNESETDSLFITSKKVEKDGSYTFAAEMDQEYKLFFYNEGEITNSISVSTKNRNQGDSLAIQIDAVNVTVLPKQALKINNINYGFGSSELTDSAKTALEKSILSLLNENTNILVEIRSHTDSVGDTQYNLKLSKERAHKVVRYLVSQGVEKERLSYKGYGESVPLYPNTNPDGTDNELGRQMNRRTEFRIIGRL